MTEQIINLKSDHFFILETYERCWRCKEMTTVFGILLPPGHEECESFVDDDENETLEWEQKDWNVVPCFVKNLSELASKEIRLIANCYFLDSSKTYGSSYWMNHCEKCGAKIGDNYIHGHPGTALNPFPDEFHLIREHRLNNPIACYSLNSVIGVEFFGVIFKDADPGRRQRIQRYAGGGVSWALMEDALDYFVSIEPDPERVIDYDTYMSQFKNDECFIKSHLILRRFGEQIFPKTLSNMQDVFYSITNLPKYLSDAGCCSTVRSYLNDALNGIGPWKT